MSQTISYEIIRSFFGGGVVIRSLKTYADTRGMVCETFRTDSDINGDSKMCYISETGPYIMRGSHEHVSQRDEFISWKNHMCYMFYDTISKESAYYITDPTKIINVCVKPRILHAYRNLDNKIAQTLNFPTSLFMGKDKKEPIDEIRHEERLSGKKAYVILGASGRLGKAVTKKFLSNLGEYDYEVIPISTRIHDSQEIVKILDDIDKATKLTKASDVTVINCAGVTNVQEANKKDKNLWWANADLPYLLGEYTGTRGFTFVHFSSDYVFQQMKEGVTAELSPYTQSKKMYEEMLNESLNSGSRKNSHVRVLRVANLFTSDLNDTNNLIQKISKNVNKFAEVKYAPELKVCPTHVDTIANWLFENKEEIADHKTFTDLTPPDIYTIKELLDTFYGGYAKHVEVPSTYIPWMDKFFDNDANGLESSSSYIVDLIESIKNNPL